MSRLWVFDIDSEFAAGYGLVRLRAREEKQIWDDRVCFPWTWARDWRTRTYTYQPNPCCRVQRTRQLRQIFTSYKVRSLRFICYGTRTFSCSTTRARLQQRHNHYINVYSGYFFLYWAENYDPIVMGRNLFNIENWLLQYMHSHIFSIFYEKIE